MPEAARDLVRRNVNVIFAATPDALATVKRATTSIPVVAVDLERDPLVPFPPCGPFLWKLGAFWRPIGRLTDISRSRTERASRVERAQMLLAYQEKPSFCAVGEKLGVHHQTVQRCVERALAYGALAALDDRPRPGKTPGSPYPEGLN